VEAKKVNVEVMGKESSGPKRHSFSPLFRLKMGVAIILDGIDFLIGWLPIANTIWDIITFLILLLMLRKKKLAFLSLIELPLLGLPPFSILDMFIPVSVITVLLDNSLSRSSRK
jgi:hypothetical protein